jgi:hypothetical protein
MGKTPLCYGMSQCRAVPAKYCQNTAHLPKGELKFKKIES